MNLDDLMAVWRSQDAAPLHGVNQTLLQLALRQDEAKLQKERRRERWIIYVFSAGIVAAMALFLAMMIYFHRHRPKSGDRLGLRPSDRRRGRRPARGGRDVCGPPARRRGASNALASRFEINSTGVSRSSTIRATIARETLVSVLLGGICPTAILLLIHRINEKSISDDGYMLVSADLHPRLVGGEQRLVNPPPGTGCVAAQAPAGGVAEGARCSVDSRLEMSAMSIRSAASLSNLARARTRAPSARKSNHVLCQNCVTCTSETTVKHRDLRGDVDAYRCCVKALNRSALVGVGVRQHARPESISKRAPSTTRTSLRLSGINSLPEGGEPCKSKL